MTQSSNYPFYVQLDGTNGLMLGQHVYVEPDIGQQEVKTGIWLSDYFINDVDSNPYVWADDGNGKLEKRSVTLGTYDENMMEYQITDGLKEEDAITFPEDGLEEGMKTVVSTMVRWDRAIRPAARMTVCLTTTMEWSTTV